ncbi:MFS family permease [Sphingomonas sp. UYAg733]
MIEGQATIAAPGRWPGLGRFGLASVSSAGVSISHLLIQLVSIHHLDAIGIGTLAFLLVVIQFGYSLSNALVSTPYTIAFNQTEDESPAALDFFFPINLLLSVAQGVICATIAWVMAGPLAAAAFGIAGVLQLLRWFGRSNAYAHHKPMGAARSDVIYAVTVLAGLAAGLMLGVTLPGVGLVVAIAALAGLLPFGTAFVRRHTPGGLGRAFAAYRPVWRDQSAWTLIGVITTEATSNAHSYIVTLMAGPRAFAPIAVGMLFFRPVNVCITALTQLERPRMTRAVARGDQHAAIQAERMFMAALVTIWLITAAAVALVLWHFPGFIISPTLDQRTVAVAVSFCALLSLVQCIQAPMSVLAQARRLFRPLAAASAYSCVVGVAGVTAITLTFAPVFSMAGVVVAQLVMMFGIYRLDKRAQRQTAIGKD